MISVIKVWLVRDGIHVQIWKGRARFVKKKREENNEDKFPEGKWKKQQKTFVE